MLNKVGFSAAIPQTQRSNSQKNRQQVGFGQVTYKERLPQGEEILCALREFFGGKGHRLSFKEDMNASRAAANGIITGPSNVVEVAVESTLNKFGDIFSSIHRQPIEGMPDSPPIPIKHGPEPFSFRTLRDETFEHLNKIWKN